MASKRVPREIRGTFYGQWLGVKRQYPQALIFVEVGDFYETFGDDAETCEREGLLTAARPSRWHAGDEGPLMAGLPKAGMAHLREELLARGHQVGIADQVREA